MKKTIRLICSNPKCNKEFEKDLYAYNQKKNGGQKNFYHRPECGWEMLEHGRILPITI